MHCLLGDATSLFANLLIGYWPYSSIEGNPLIWSERQWVVIADTVAVDVSFRSVQHTWAACFVPHPSFLGSEQSTTSGSKKPIMWYWFQVERECRGWDNKLCLLFPSPAAPGDGISLKQAERKSLSALWMTSQRWERISLLPLSLGLCVCLSLSHCLSSLYSTRWLFFSGHKGVSLNPITPVLSLTNIKITPTTTTLRIFFASPTPVRFPSAPFPSDWRWFHLKGGRDLQGSCCFSSCCYHCWLTAIANPDPISPCWWPLIPLSNNVSAGKNPTAPNQV